jgi:hypothetical protein
MQRLKSVKEFELLNSLPVYFLPIVAKIHDSPERFNNLITAYVAKHLHHN